MKCHILFSEKNKKNISKCRLLKILPRVLSVKLLKSGISSRKVATFGISRTQIKVQCFGREQGKTGGWGKHYRVWWTIYVTLHKCKHTKTFSFCHKMCYSLDWC